MSYQVVAVDLAGDGGMSHAHTVLTTLENIGQEVTAQTYVVVATHGNFDEMALETILRAQPSYVGLVASGKRATAVRDYLRFQGLSESDLLPLKAPAGLDIQARRGDEIALSIMAEIVQRRRNAELLDLALFQPKEEAGGCGCGEEEVVGEETAVDPVCGMTVQINGAAYTHVHQGQTYYFCCAGCQMSFAQQPEAYLTLSA